jgi:hypothetical protein
LGFSQTVTTAEVQSSPKGLGASTVLKSAKHNSWKKNIALVESFFYMHTNSEQMCLPRDKAPETRERHMISSEKLMVTIVWNPGGFPAIKVFRTGPKFKVDDHCSSMLQRFRKQPDRSGTRHEEN